jgi:hypothetical protein
MLATELGLRLGLPVAPVRVIEVSGWLIEHTPELRVQLAGQQIPCHKGKQLGSLYVGDEHAGTILDSLPRELLKRVRNLADFARVLVLDKWTANCDGRQAVFFRKTPNHRRYDACFVDQGYCFNVGEWTFPDSPLRGVYANSCVYEEIKGWDAFEPTLSRSEAMDAQVIWSCSREIPEEWYEGDRGGLVRLTEQLSKRRAAIRNLIREFRNSSRNPFPNWKDPVTADNDVEAGREGRDSLG